MHIASLLGAASLLMSARNHWSGTLEILFQPAEEQLGGAQHMVNDGLYDQVPVPDVLLAQHIGPYRAGDVLLKSGPVLSSSDQLSIRVHGKGGHGSAPDVCIDPVVIAAYIIVRLQTIVSREVHPGNVAVVSCGSIQAGTAPNIIPDYADLSLNVRTFDGDTRSKILESIDRIVRAECRASGVDEDPEIVLAESAPSTTNDAKTAEALKGAFKTHFDKEALKVQEKNNASEDFSNLARPIEKPYVLWGLGCIDPHVWDRAEKEGNLQKIPSNHSSKFMPAIQPTLKTAVDAMALAALEILST